MREHGLTIQPRLTLFYQGMSSGVGPHSFEFSGKADVLFNANLGKFGLGKGLGLTVHAEQNFGNSVNLRGGGMVMVNTAMGFPGAQGGDTFDLSSVYFSQTLGKGTTLLVGKVNAIDGAANKPFMGGAGIDAFWNCTFVAPPSGTVPPYLFGALLSMRTKNATYGFWVYDPTSVVNKSCFDKPFSEGITFRGSVEFPIEIDTLGGHQGLTALYSTENGRDMATVGDIFLPGPKGPIRIKDSRYYFAYSFDQYLYQSKENPKEGVGMFGQFGISDGNPNRLYWSALVGLGGTGLIPGRPRDNWGIGYYYDAPSTALKKSLAPVTILRDEQGWEAFYNFEVTPGLTVGADLQIIRPAMKNETAVYPGLRTVLKF